MKRNILAIFSLTKLFAVGYIAEDQYAGTYSVV